MKILVATARTQGRRAGDFNFCIEGELVEIGLVCARDRADPDNGGCGCGRSFGGLNSHRATTTALVAELPLSVDDYTEALASSLEHGGWLRRAAGARNEAVALAALAAEWPAGTVVRRRLDDLEFDPPKAMSS